MTKSVYLKLICLRLTTEKGIYNILLVYETGNISEYDTYCITYLYRKLKPRLYLCFNINCSMFYSRDISASNSYHYIDLQIKKKNNCTVRSVTTSLQ